jgi:hypothetical protein
MINIEHVKKNYDGWLDWNTRAINFELEYAGTFVINLNFMFVFSVEIILYENFCFFLFEGGYSRYFRSSRV